MNFLAHLYLSGNDPDILVGNFMGDFVKGRVDDGYPDPVRNGILLHRRIDSYTQNHPLFLRSRQRIGPGYRLYRGVLVDIFYDHFLAREWDSWSAEPLDSWLVRTRAIINLRRAELPEKLQSLVEVIFDELLPSYREVTGIGRALARMSRRITRPNPLAGAERELVTHYTELSEDFRSFLPDVTRFAQEYCDAISPGIGKSL